MDDDVNAEHVINKQVYNAYYRRRQLDRQKMLLHMDMTLVYENFYERVRFLVDQTEKHGDVLS